MYDQELHFAGDPMSASFGLARSFGQGYGDITQVGIRARHRFSGRKAKHIRRLIMSKEFFVQLPNSIVVREQYGHLSRWLYLLMAERFTHCLAYQRL
jgi:hypothetical protein